MIPKGWEVVSLNQFADINMGQSPKSEYYNNQGNGLPFHQGIKDFGFRFPSHQTFSTIEKKVANSGDILLSVRAPVGRMNVADQSIVIGRGLCGLRSKSGHQAFLYYKLRDVFKVIDSMGSGTVFNSINKKDVENLKVLVPEDSTLQKFEELASKWDKQIKCNTEESLILQQTRDYLLPKLLSGEIDVSEAKETVESALQ
ncbi:restriction endonuclease subunit S [Lentibacillus juripiscarius]|uniref:Restriction endonuclease subunit S n=1 Tax=Lentibacillus juripiscarius TaxID=257446 RepID=A0ABW5V860_9BACI